MRHIKFRAWDKLEKKMIDPMQQNYNFLKGHNDGTGNWILEQFTGLLDKAGKEIYEGDYVKQASDVFEIVSCIGGYKCLKVKGGDKGSLFIFACLTSKHCLVVGNIHENPELLKRKTAKR